MKLENISLEETGCFSSTFIQYLNQDPQLRGFYHRPPQIDNFADQIVEKKFSPEKRQVLVEVLKEQYEGIEFSELTEQNINSLGSDNTFTVTTGHQLNICTGPLYFLYKIVTVINSCKELKAKYPDQNFVPVYWMATEDHDLDEIKYFYLFGEKVEWDTDQTGPVGRMKPSLESIFEKLPEIGTFFKKHTVRAIVSRML